jgi:hypothetical protein
MHPTIDGPKPKVFSPANSNSCAYCGAILAYTLDRVCHGIKGIQAIYVEQEKCPKKPAALFEK